MEEYEQEKVAMKLDVDVLRYLSKEDFRVLTAVEMGMRNVRNYALSLSLCNILSQLRALQPSSNN
ncbi:unnamed protein product [Ilex paraguariensis]|uniref:RIO2 kinase winged helix domain-containing protein n=1 Tax=Ilex paraguariensis TaxID=185542 RepID=A0ABC8R052_9AQUA